MADACFLMTYISATFLPTWYTEAIAMRRVLEWLSKETPFEIKISLSADVISPPPISLRKASLDRCKLIKVSTNPLSICCCLNQEKATRISLSSWCSSIIRWNKLQPSLKKQLRLTDLVNKCILENEPQRRKDCTSVNLMAADPGDDGHVDGDDDCVAESITSVNCGFVRLLSHKKGGGTVLARTWNWAQKLKVKDWTQK